MLTHDLFPVRVRLGDLKLAGARVAVDGEGRGIVLAGNRAEGIEVIASGTVASAERTRRTRDWTITLASGEVWEVTEGGGCGCGNPLRRHNAERSIIEVFAVSA